MEKELDTRYIERLFFNQIKDLTLKSIKPVVNAAARPRIEVIA